MPELRHVKFTNHISGFEKNDWKNLAMQPGPSASKRACTYFLDCATVQLVFLHILQYKLGGFDCKTQKVDMLRLSSIYLFF